MTLVDVVVVTYNSAGRIRPALEALTGAADLSVVVVDNASSDGTVDAIADLNLTTIALEKNIGFGAGCNVGWRSGSSPYVLFLNPDTHITADGIRALAGVAARDAAVGAVGPRLVDEEGGLDYSIRRFPRLRSTYARAFFLQRLFPRATWVDEVVRDPRAYERAHPVEWITGACLLAPRAVLEKLSGFDERYFVYCEDKDLCARLRDAGYTVLYQPSITATHLGGEGSVASRTQRRALLTRSRIQYAAAHSGTLAASAEKLGLALEAAVRLVVGPGGLEGRRGRLDELRILAGGLLD